MNSEEFTVNMLRFFTHSKREDEKKSMVEANYVVGHVQLYIDWRKSSEFMFSAAVLQ